jgi:hypothetical protein
VLLAVIAELLVPSAVERFQGCFNRDSSPAAGRRCLGEAQSAEFRERIGDFEIGVDSAPLLQPRFRGPIKLTRCRTRQSAAPQQPPGKHDLAELLLLGLGQQVIDDAGVVVEVLK